MNTSDILMVSRMGATVLGTVKDGRLRLPPLCGAFGILRPPLCAVAAEARRNGKHPEPSTSLRRVEQEAG